MEKLRIINIALFIIAITLIIFTISQKNVGNFILGNSIVENIEPTNLECNFNGNEIPIDLCCPQIERQLRCIQENDNIKCYTLEENSYYINSQTFNYCKKEGYDVKIK